MREKLKASSFFIILTTFGFQSLVYLPLMFALNDKSRPSKYFGLLSAENVTIVIAIMCFKIDLASLSEMSSILNIPALMYIIIAFGLTMLGMLFIFFYMLWKPKNTEYWKLYLDNEEQRVNSFPVTYGVYYEYFGVAFTIPVEIIPHDLEEFGRKFE